MLNSLGIVSGSICGSFQDWGSFRGLTTLEDITYLLKQAGEIQTPSIIDVGARIITILNKLSINIYYCMHYSITGLDSTIADNILVGLKACRQYLKTDLKNHTARESYKGESGSIFGF